MNRNLKQVFLKPGKERAVRNRHPWIFSGALKKVDDHINIGDAVLINDHRGESLAIGHWCGDDGLVVRIVSFDNDVSFDQDFWVKHFNQAKNLRSRFLLPNNKTNGYRLIHGEGDGLSGLVCDIFADVASIQLTNPGLSCAMEYLNDFLRQQCGIKHIHLAASDRPEGRPTEGLFIENGLKFIADVSHGQKTGHFLDQRDNRALVKELAFNRFVLDAFCYSGGFSVYALSGGAKAVTSVDISQSALLLCERNIKENDLSNGHSAVEADCFDYLRQVKKNEFDFIILDPPAFAKTAKAVPRAARGYKDINLCALKMVAPGGLITTFSCSQHISMDLFKKIIFAAALDSGREVKIVRELWQGADHPVSVYCPQSLYLKGLILYVE